MNRPGWLSAACRPGCGLDGGGEQTPLRASWPTLGNCSPEDPDRARRRTGGPTAGNERRLPAAQPLLHGQPAGTGQAPGRLPGSCLEGGLRRLCLGLRPADAGTKERKSIRVPLEPVKAVFADVQSRLRKIVLSRLHEGFTFQRGRRRTALQQGGKACSRRF